MGRLIRDVGPCGLVPETRRQPYHALISAVAHQQLTGRVAEVILKRFRALFAGRGFPTPEAILRLSETQLRSVGFSRAKALAIQDIAAKAVEGLVPSSRGLKNLPDNEIIERLTQVRGVGRWTVEMLLMFKLGRPDVLPVDDFGVRKGYCLAYGLQALPRPKELLEFGERWRPYRTTAAWYLWRAVELHAPPKPAKRVKE
jgi:DNA-3-methyladenine glycosylase II